MTTLRALAFGLAATLLAAPPVLAAAAPAAAPSATDGLWGPALRTLASLAAVLAVLAVCAWLARRLRDRGAFRGGLIEVVSGVSLGGREKVVLLRVGDEQVLVGISPAGMRPLHVLRGAAPRHDTFGSYMEQRP